MACYTMAILAYLKRHTDDTNPRIMQALDDHGEPESHWYYMSDECVFTSAFVAGGEIQAPYEGPLSGLDDVAREYLSRGVECEFGNMRARTIATNDAERDRFLAAAAEMLM